MAGHDWHFDGTTELKEYPGQSFPQFYCNFCATAFVILTEFEPNKFDMRSKPDPTEGGGCIPDPKWHYWKHTGLYNNKSEQGRHFAGFECSKCGRFILDPIDIVGYTPLWVDYPSVNDGGDCLS